MDEARFEERRVAGLRCGEVLERLSDYVDGELEPVERAAVDGHLAGCSNCARFGGAFAGVVAAVRGSGLPVAGPDPAFLDALRRRRDDG